MKRAALLALVLTVIALRVAGGPLPHPQVRARLPRGFAAPEGRAWPPAVELVVQVNREGR